MGREVRRVAPNWEHPKREVPDWRTGRMVEQYQPVYDTDFETAMTEWLGNLKKWMESEFEQVKVKHPEYKDPYRSFCEYYGTAPDPIYHRPVWSEEEATAFQMYETVSEGTPVSPVFETADGLIDYLVSHGDFWSQRRAAEEGTNPCWSRAAAEGFVNAGWAPSMMVVQTSTSTQVIQPSDAEMYTSKEGE